MKRSFQELSRIVTAVSALVALGSFLTFKPEAEKEETKNQRPTAPPIAGLESVDFGMEPTVDPTAPMAGELPRRVLALYNGGETMLEDDEQTGRVNAVVRRIEAEVSVAHRLAELPLNHLGLVVDHQDAAADPLPSPQEMKKYRGVLVWFGDQRLPNADAFLTWLIEQSTAGRRVVVIGDPAQMEDRNGGHPRPELTAQLLERIGGEYLGRWPEDPTSIKVVQKDDQMIGFERPIPDRIEAYQRYRARPPSKVYLSLGHQEPGEKVRETSDLVWTNAAGGFALGSLAEIEDHIEDRFVTRWLINPFLFFERAFGVEGWPRLDFTTLNGRRLLYLHIDGDGLDTISELDYKSRCGALIRDQIIKKYDLPFTASVIVGLTAPPPIGRGSPEDMEVARSIFALDNVEVGSHGLAHPMDWRAGARVELSVPDLPDYAMSGESEVKRSVEYINQELAPPSKPCRIMLWTGSCNPKEDQLAWAYRLRLRNLNGGDPRMDNFYPSYAHLAAVVHPVGRLFQYFTSAANDYIHTQDWTPPYYRFQNVIQTFEKSGAPRRIVPVNVYFHFYSARNLAALTGLRRVMDWVDARPLAPIFASEYVDIARDFLWARIAKSGPDQFTVDKGRYIRTVRFDSPEVHLDLSRSSGVLGYENDAALGVTYVHLGGDARAVLQLVKSDLKQPRLREASHWVDDLKISEAGLSFVTRGTGKRTFVFENLTPGARFTVSGGSTHEATADAAGRLELHVDQTTPARIAISLKPVGGP